MDPDGDLRHYACARDTVNLRAVATPAEQMEGRNVGEIGVPTVQKGRETAPFLRQRPDLRMSGSFAPNVIDPEAVERDHVQMPLLVAALHRHLEPPADARFVV